MSKVEPSGPPTDITVKRLRDVDSMEALAADAELDGQGMVAQLIREWHEGTNRFDKPGERLYGGFLSDRLVGVCGLNTDPFAKAFHAGRVRRLYVATDCRRRGIATALLRVILDDAAGRYDALHVRTYNEDARAFYRSLGFSEVVGDVHCTHKRSVVPVR